LRKFWYVSIGLVAFLTYYGVTLSPAVYWPAGFAGFIIPVLLMVLGIFFIRAALYKRWSAIFYLILLAIGFNHIQSTFAVAGIFNSSKGEFDVLSFNVRVFNTYQYLRNDDLISSKQMIRWTVDHPAAIKCIQEYYNLDDSDVYNVAQKMRKAGFIHHHNRIVFRDKNNGEFGMAIFSKYPFTNTGTIISEDKKFQNAMYADVVLPTDTIRIYNIHFESMSIDEENIFNTERLKNSYLDTGYKLRKGLATRAVQVDYLIQHILESPYPVVLCGDFNEMPYSYVYQRLSKIMNNAFETAGFGFGFSFNGRLFFLRIDNQFFTRDLKAQRFKTRRDMTHSDHFPLEASYSILR
jgi:endonuclease/exonuclease/phosphatase family metal-dependent hydrolase